MIMLMIDSINKKKNTVALTNHNAIRKSVIFKTGIILAILLQYMYL